MKVSIHAFVLSRDKKDRESERKKKENENTPSCLLFLPSFFSRLAVCLMRSYTA